MSAKQRIALYGGTFDPVHVGHLEIAREIAKLFEIEKVIFVPADLAPHKTGRAVTSSIHRYAMLALATQASPKLSISTFELDAPDRRYTVDTVSHFQKTLGPDVELFFIMGADSWSEISSWREWERLVAMVNHIVVTRPGYQFGEAPVAANRIVELRRDGPRDDLIKSTGGPHVFMTNAVMRDVSASRIRLKARAGKFEELAGLVPEPVLEYIRKYRLYQTLMTQDPTVKQQSLNPQVRHAPAAMTTISTELDERVSAAIEAASEKKALDLVVLDLREIASFTDYFVIASGANERQVQAIADELYEKLKKSGSTAARVEGYKTAEWVLLDFGDFVVHVFEQKARQFYDLERLWREARKVELPAGLSGNESSSVRKE